MKKKLVFVSLSLFLISSVSAYTFGSLPYTTSKEVTDRNITFQIGLTNPGDSKIRVDLEASGLDNGEVIFPKQSFILEPTEVSENPSGDGWISMDTGTYARVQKVPFYVLMDKKTDESFNIRLEASRIGKGSDSGIRPRAVQVRDYEYQLNYPENEEVRVDRGYQRDEKEGEDLEVIKRDRSQEAEKDYSGVETNETEEINRSQNVSKASKASTNSNSTEEGIDSLTMVLGVGVLGSMAYLWMVI